MWTKKKTRKLAHELLGLVGLAAGISLILFLLVQRIATAVAEGYCFDHDIPMTELEWIPIDRLIFGGSMTLACICFTVLFLLMLHDRIAYIRTITEGIAQLQTQQKQLDLPLRGNNELTTLAGAVNTLSASQLALREKDQALQQERETLIRSLSHDIRTPLTSILAYAEYLNTKETLTPEEQRTYLQLIEKKAGQIRDLTAVLLDGGRRNPEFFPDARLLMEQLAAEFAEALEEQFQVEADLSGCSPFSGSFDVQELRRIFDNLISNIQKYADPAQPVRLSIGCTDNLLRIHQSNHGRPVLPQAESYQIGLLSILRIVQQYSGQVEVDESADSFSITVSVPVNL